LRPLKKKKNLSIFNPKNCILSSQKYGLGIRDPDKNINIDPDPGVKKSLDPVSRPATLLGNGT